MYGSGAAMGFTPREVDQMSLWEFRAAVDGWNRANGNTEDSGGGAALSEREKDEIWEWMHEMPPVPVNRMH